MNFVDLSHRITPDIPVFSDEVPSPSVEPWHTHAEARASETYRDCSCEISRAEFVTSIGTYLDSPYHFDPDGETIDELELEQLVVPGIVIDCTDVEAREAIGGERLEDRDFRDRAVLFHTGWSEKWKTPEYPDHPYLTQSAADALLEGGARLVGIDTLIIDDPENPNRPVHDTLLREDVLIVENLTDLGAISSDDFLFHAVPAKFAGAAAFPVRAYAVEQTVLDDVT